MSWNSGAQLVVPAGELPFGSSSMIATTYFGLSAGNTPANVEVIAVCEYSLVSGSTFCAVPVLPATW